MRAAVSGPHSVRQYEESCPAFEPPPPLGLYSPRFCVALAALSAATGATATPAGGPTAERSASWGQGVVDAGRGAREPETDHGARVADLRRELAPQPCDRWSHRLACPRRGQGRRRCRAY